MVAAHRHVAATVIERWAWVLNVDPLVISARDANNNGTPWGIARSNRKNVREPP